jgi:hypothetical protein
MNLYNQKWVLWFAQNGSTTNAITIGQTTYYSEPEDIVKFDLAWQKHEHRHQEQWAREGFLKFAVKYLWYQIRYGYSKNPYEVAANQ